MTQPIRLPADDAQCGWYHTSKKRTPNPAHNGMSTCPWVVVGAGYTGLAAARQLAVNFPDENIILIEAQQIGFGLAGRNAGFAIDLPHDIGAKDYIGDLDIARTVLKMNRFGQSVLAKIVGDHHISCSWKDCGKYQAGVAKRGLAALEAYQKGLDKLGEQCTMINGDELPSHLGTSFYKKALFTPGTKLMQPSALIKGLADSLPSNVTLYENTPIERIEQGTKITLKHAQGEIIADNVILANNNFAAHFGFLENKMLPIFLYASLTRVLTEEEQKVLGGKEYWGVIPADPHGSTVRRTPDQRILIRNSMTFNPNGLPRKDALDKFKATNHLASFKNRFPMLPKVDFEYSWSGGIVMSHNHESFFGKLAPRIYGSLCCNGLGVTRGTASGVLLADWVSKQVRGKSIIPGHSYNQDCTDVTEFLLSSKGPNNLPPEPFLSLGVNATLALGHWRAGIEC